MKSKRPLVSIVLPTYYSEEKLTIFIELILNSDCSKKLTKIAVFNNKLN
jgi:glycosyltransferase involved in cell wall biosynthesis